ncbi:MAG: DUF6544 family protein [Spirochaetota bacterium]
MNRFLKTALYAVAFFSVLGITLVYFTIASNTSYQKDWNSLKQENTGKTLSEFMLFGLPPAAERFLKGWVSIGTEIRQSLSFSIQGKILQGKKWQSYTGELLVTPFRGYLKRMRLPNGIAEEFLRDDRAYQQFRVFGVFPSTKANDKQILQKNFLKMLAFTTLYPTSFLLQSGIGWQNIGNGEIRYKHQKQVYQIISKESSYQIKKIGDNLTYRLDIQLVETQQGLKIPHKFSLSANGKEVEQLVVHLVE